MKIESMGWRRLVTHGDSGEGRCSRKLIMAAKISNLSKRHFCREVEYLRYSPCVFNRDYEEGGEGWHH